MSNVSPSNYIVSFSFTNGFLSGALQRALNIASCVASCPTEKQGHRLLHFARYEGPTASPGHLQELLLLMLSVVHVCYNALVFVDPKMVILDLDVLSEQMGLSPQGRPNLRRR